MVDNTKRWRAASCALAGIIAAGIGTQWYFTREKNPALHLSNHLRSEQGYFSMYLRRIADNFYAAAHEGEPDIRVLSSELSPAIPRQFHGENWQNEYRILINPDEKSWESYKPASISNPSRALIVALPLSLGDENQMMYLERTHAMSVGRMSIDHLLEVAPWLPDAIRFGHENEPALPNGFFDKK